MMMLLMMMLLEEWSNYCTLKNVNLEFKVSLQLIINGCVLL